MPRAGVFAWCPNCERAVETLATLQAAGILELDYLAVHGLIAEGVVHAIQVSGNQRICKESLIIGSRAPAGELAIPLEPLKRDSERSDE